MDDDGWFAGVASNINDVMMAIAVECEAAASIPAVVGVPQHQISIYFIEGVLCIDKGGAMARVGFIAIVGGVRSAARIIFSIPRALRRE